MDKNTTYVHDHIVNFEPTYLALMRAVRGALSANELRTIVRRNYQQCGLRSPDLIGVNYAAMIEWESDNG